MIKKRRNDQCKAHYQQTKFQGFCKVQRKCVFQILIDNKKKRMTVYNMYIV